jgi:hypothetical protein
MITFAGWSRGSLISPGTATSMTAHRPLTTATRRASFVAWVCPALRVGRTATGTDVPLVDVRRPGPQSDLGRLMKGFGRLAGRASCRTPGGDIEGRFVYTDPAGILDVALRGRIENWRSARHGDGVVRPAEL